MKKNYRLQISQHAVNDLQNLLDSVQPHAWTWALRTHAKLLRDMNDLKKFPRLGSPCPEFDGLRSRVSGPFRIYYEVDDKSSLIKVYRFWSTLRDDPSWDDLLD